jgi:hypothetical protein
MSKRPGAFGSGVKMSQERKAAAANVAKSKRPSAAPAKPSKVRMGRRRRARRRAANTTF